MRCVCDFEMTPAAPLTDAQMTEVMTAGLLKNLQETARRIEHTTEESNDG